MSSGDGGRHRALGSISCPRHLSKDKPLRSRGYFSQKLPSTPLSFALKFWHFDHGHDCTGADGFVHVVLDRLFLRFGRFFRMVEVKADSFWGDVASLLVNVFAQDATKAGQQKMRGRMQGRRFFARIGQTLPGTFRQKRFGLFSECSCAASSKLSGSTIR